MSLDSGEEKVKEINYELKTEKFMKHVLKQWNVKKENEEKTREMILIMMYLMDNYRLKCLIGTIIDLDDMAEKFFKEERW
jgi:hypothetical protein